jgi:hypothetical protein
METGRVPFLNATIQGLALVLLTGMCAISSLYAQADAARTRIALYQPVAQKEDAALVGALSTVADSVELGLSVLQHYEVVRLPAADPAIDLDRVRADCRRNRIDQAILGRGEATTAGGYGFSLEVYDRKRDKITTVQNGSSKSVLGIFDVIDTMVASLLDTLSGTHLAFGSLAVQSDPSGAAITVNGKDVGQAPVSLRVLPVGTVVLSGRMPGHDSANITVSISDGETANASLALPRSMGTLAFEMPREAAATIRGAEIGQKSVAGTGMEQLPTGDYDVQASCPGLPQISGKVTVNRSETTRWLPWSKGYLDVSSNPSGATVFVDGVRQGVSPLVVELEPGIVHRVEMRLLGYQTYDVDISENAGTKTALSRKLAADLVFSGVGIGVEKVQDGMFVSRVFVQGPAEKAGIKPGDLITKVGGAPTKDMNLQDFGQAVRGEPGSNVEFSVLPSEYMSRNVLIPSPKTVSVGREIITPFVFQARAIDSNEVFEAKVEGLSYFPGNDKAPALNERKYGVMFDHSLPFRSVYTQIHLSFEPSDHTRTISLVFKRQSKSDTNSRSIDVVIQPGWNHVYSWVGYNGRGLVHVEISLDKAVIAKGAYVWELQD